MEKFVVSARKYRPITFDSVVGQSHITTTLRNAIKTDHLAQAFLFCGPRGVGKTTCARILAKTINCQNVSESIEPCNECTSCKNFSQNASFNIHELDAASNNSVEDIRNLIDQVRFPPQDGKYKVYIIDEVHMLSQAAFNAFLKTLEEPPSYAIFILATTEKHKILPTILSRCQIFDFNRIQIKDMADHLSNIAIKEGIETEYEALELIAQKADGGLRDALSMFDLNVTFSKDRKLNYAEVLDNLHILDYDYYFKMVNALFAGDLAESLLVFNEILAKGFDGHQFVIGLNEHFRNLLVCQDPKTISLLEVSESVKAKYQSQATLVSKGFLMSGLSVGSQLDLNYKASKNQRLHTEIGLMKLSQITNVLNLASLGPSEDQKKNPNAITEVVSSTTTLKIGDAAKVNQNVSVSVPSLGTVKTVSTGGIPSKFQSSRLRSTISLETEVDNLNKAKVVSENQSNQIQSNQEFTKEQAKLALEEFAKTREKTTEQMMFLMPFDLENKVITIKIYNILQEQLLNELKQELLDFLRNALKNSNVQVNSIVTAEETKAKPRTEQEKFNAMAEKNPALWELKDQLGLDLIY